MDPDERVMALKKAYAEIILNTAKEAAARVMMSERKAQRFEHELKLAKDEGLRMLLRIKQMMDSTVSEAELTALSQKRKIDELEAQLHEAEDIVRDLREELREVQSELERVKTDKARCLDKSDIPTHRQLEMNRLYNSQLSEFRPPELYSGSIFSHTMGRAFNNQSNAAHNCYRTSVYCGYSNEGRPNLPSIISRRKEPFYYKNGCTQRIRACEKDRLVEEFSLSASINKTKDEINIKEVEGGKVTCNQQRKENENKKTSKKNLIQGNVNPDYYLVNKRQGESGHLQKEKLSSINISEESTKIDQALSCLSPNSAGDACLNYGCSETSPRLVSRKGELSMHSACEGNSETGGKLVNCLTDQGKEDRHARLTREMEQQNMECGESSDIMDPAKGNRPSSIELEYNESETGNKLLKQTLNNRHFKYTFQRKRKRDSLVNGNESIDNNLQEEYVPVENSNIFKENCDRGSITSPENGTPKESTSNMNADLKNNTLLRDAAEEQTSSVEMPRFSSVIESPQVSMGLLPIFHQVISMPEKVGSIVSSALAE